MNDSEFKASVASSLRNLERMFLIFMCWFCFWSGCINGAIRDIDTDISFPRTINARVTGDMNDVPIKVQHTRRVPVTIMNPEKIGR